ncbi:hypothetical protein [Streptomyces echinatus]|uniref:hypothetical protein n=1 Tax=Streptomyces echinatus TaxID=67293 RepID=UPI0037A5D776
MTVLAAFEGYDAGGWVTAALVTVVAVPGALFGGYLFRRRLVAAMTKSAER